MSNIAFIDVETDGLDATVNSLLEIACLVTDENLNVLDNGGYHAVVRIGSPFTVTRMYEAASSVVQEMHTRTGLWEKLSGPDAKPRMTIDRELRAYLERFGTPGSMPVGGNSVRLDMNFIDEDLPAVSSFLDYHMRDVSTIAGLVSDWYPSLPRFEKHNDHTAMTDIRECIRELRYYRETAFKASFAKMPQWERDEVTADVMSYLLSVGYTITAPGTVDPKPEEVERKIAELERELAFKKRSNARLANRYVEAERSRQRLVSETTASRAEGAALARDFIFQAAEGDDADAVISAGLALAEWVKGQGK